LPKQGYDCRQEDQKWECQLDAYRELLEKRCCQASKEQAITPFETTG
jgi:hypothetical protein